MDVKAKVPQKAKPETPVERRKKSEITEEFCRQSSVPSDFFLRSSVFQVLLLFFLILQECDPDGISYRCHRTPEFRSRSGSHLRPDEVAPGRSSQEVVPRNRRSGIRVSRTTLQPHGRRSRASLTRFGSSPFPQYSSSSGGSDRKSEARQHGASSSDVKQDQPPAFRCPARSAQTSALPRTTAQGSATVYNSVFL